jgi:1-aminocyclopropane-1-carboxylate deaminase/D-cysteine desulfhydrase-like pyridoxal-dependent ACC family enzyme
MARLEAALRRSGAPAVPRLHIKRDDLLTLGMGGNKVRNLEFLMARALGEGATHVLTSGRQQSNHCRLTAAACARVGLGCDVVLSGIEPAMATGNLLLSRVFGARTHFVGSDDRAERATRVGEVAAGIERAGGRTFIIGVGGSDTTGALGHVVAARELMAQANAAGWPIGAVVLATATGGTQAGMLAGFAAMNRRVDVRGFAVAKSAAELSAEVRELAQRVAISIGGPSVAADAVRIDDSELGGGYGAPTAAASAAAALLARREGMVVDPVYTAKGLAGLLALVRRGTFAAVEDVVFLHTGGTPTLFA